MPQSAPLLFPSQKRQHASAEQRIRNYINVDSLASRIDKIPAGGASLEGAGIFFIDSNYNIVKLRDFSARCRKNPIYIVLKAPENPKTELAYAAELATRDRESKLVLEASTTLITCTAMVISWLAVVGGAAAVPVSGGSSVVMSSVAYGAATATTFQCINGGFRTYSEVFTPETLDALDSEPWYAHISQALDVISLAGAGAASYAAIRSAQTLRASTGKSYREALSGLNRQERKRLTEEVIRNNHPNVSNQALKAMIRRSLYPTRYTTAQINHALKINVKNAVSASLSFSGSAISGVTRNMAVGIYEAIS